MYIDGCGVTMAKHQRIRCDVLVMHYNVAYTQNLEGFEVANNYDINQCGGLWGFYSNNFNELGIL